MASYVEKALTLSQRAVHFDKIGNIPVAIFYYREAAKHLDLATGSSTEQTENFVSECQSKRNEYLERANELDNISKEEELCKAQSIDQKMIQRCNFLFSQALDADEQGHNSIAIQLYGEVVEFAIKTKNSTLDEDVQNKLITRAKQALDRAEVLKGISNATTITASSTASVPSYQASVTGVTSETKDKPSLHRGSSGHLKVSGIVSYTEEEKHVLKTTSRINKIDYVPFMNIDLKERFQYAIPFTDKDGLLNLSPKQKHEFARWARPEEIYPEPKMINGNFVDYFSIKQTIVSDCSFVASLAVSALYERRFNKSLITPIIYPRNRNKQPVYNPFGKYMIKLHINGVPRKVIIDDMLPVGRHGELLCSYSTRPGELWISLLEKAYMKVMGGYDFPGSNSNIDLHALTGWIPERIAIRQNENFNKDSLFSMLEERTRRGHCLGTVATGEMDDSLAERTGLVPTHAYAILDVRTVQGAKLFLLKNPWSHVRWRGNYSELDTVHWTNSLKNELNYDPASASMFDNGIFWIDYESIIHFFDVFYINWNPEIFTFTYCVHSLWKAGMGPVKDVYNIGENPQYKLDVGDSGNKSGSVWILLTRHITNISDFRNNQEYITVLVYKSNGNKIYYPNDPYIDGIRINSPHYLCKIVLNENSCRKYTLVVSQYEKMNGIFYTLRAYSTLPFTLNKIEDKFTYRKEVSDQWKGPSAGGCANNPLTYVNNPCYQVKIDTASSLLIDLKGPKQYQVGFDVVCVVSSSGTVEKKSSGAFRSGFAILELEQMPPGTYNITPSTFYAGQEGPFILAVKSTSPITLAKLG